jgi:hypothetical protein
VHSLDFTDIRTHKCQLVPDCTFQLSATLGASNELGDAESQRRLRGSKRRGPIGIPWLVAVESRTPPDNGAGPWLKFACWMRGEDPVRASQGRSPASPLFSCLFRTTASKRQLFGADASPLSALSGAHASVFTLGIFCLGNDSQLPVATFDRTNSVWYAPNQLFVEAANPQKATVPRGCPYRCPLVDFSFSLQRHS